MTRDSIQYSIHGSTGYNDIKLGKKPKCVAEEDPNGLESHLKYPPYFVSKPFMIWLLDSSVTVCPTSLFLFLSSSSHTDSSSFPEHIKHIPISGPGHVLFPTTFLPQIITQPSPSCPVGLCSNVLPLAQNVLHKGIPPQIE